MYSRTCLQRPPRPPAMYGQFSDVPIIFQRKCPWDGRPPGGRRHGHRYFVIFHLLWQTVNFILQNKFLLYFKDGVDHFLFSAMDAGNGESTQDYDPQLVTHLNLESFSHSIYPVIKFFSKFLVMSSDNKCKIYNLYLQPHYNMHKSNLCPVIIPIKWSVIISYLI